MNRIQWIRWVGRFWLAYSVYSSLPVGKMNDIVASKINLLAILLKRGLPKRSSSHRASELILSNSSPGISETWFKRSLHIWSYMGQCRRKCLLSSMPVSDHMGRDICDNIKSLTQSPSIVLIRGLHRVLLSLTQNLVISKQNYNIGHQPAAINHSPPAILHLAYLWELS